MNLIRFVTLCFALVIGLFLSDKVTSKTPLWGNQARPANQVDTFLAVVPQVTWLPSREGPGYELGVDFLDTALLRDPLHPFRTCTINMDSATARAYAGFWDKQGFHPTTNTPVRIERTRTWNSWKMFTGWSSTNHHRIIQS